MKEMTTVFSKAVLKKSFQCIIALALSVLFVFAISSPMISSAVSESQRSATTDAASKNASATISPFVLLRNGDTTNVELWLVVNSNYIVSQVRFKSIKVKSTSPMQNKPYGQFKPASGKTYFIYNMNPAAKKGRIRIGSISIPKSIKSAIVIPSGAQYYKMSSGWTSVGATAATVPIT